MERWVSGTALAIDCDGPDARDAHAVVTRAAAGEAKAQAALTRHADRLARGLAVIVNILDPDVIVLGGGLSNMAHLYVDVAPIMYSHVFFRHGRDPDREEPAWRQLRRPGRCLAVGAAVAAICRDCDEDPGPSDRCQGCGGRRIVRHAELLDLTIAHVDCDAFFASVEKRDRPELAALPVIVGGGTRGVVSTACYVARMSGVHSAMPMFKALRACPDAVVIRPDFAKYSAASRQIRALMQALTPLVRMQSIDEATLDLAGTQALHGAAPAVVLARFARAVERDVGVSVSIGLARNPMVAKIAAGRDKPRGFTVLGTEAAALLAGEPVGILPGIGPAVARGLAAKGLFKVADLQALDERAARARLGEDGPSLVRRAWLEDTRPVRPSERANPSARKPRSTPISPARPSWSDHCGSALRRSPDACGRRVWRRRGVTLKLKTAAFASRTRSRRLDRPTQLPDLLFAQAASLLTKEVDGTTFRLIGLAAQTLVDAAGADAPDLADPDSLRRPARQQAIEALRARYGAAVIARGRGLKREG